MFFFLWLYCGLYVACCCFGFAAFSFDSVWFFVLPLMLWCWPVFCVCGCFVAGCCVLLWVLPLCVCSVLLCCCVWLC